MPLDVARQVLLEQHLQRAFVTFSPVGADPLAALLERDARKQTDLSRSLLTWLEHHADVSSAAATLGLHPNTLRYRIARARELLGADLDEPLVRCEVFLRLRALLSR